MDVIDFVFRVALIPDLVGGNSLQIGGFFMKKLSTRLFSFLAVFCLVFFSFPLVSFAQKNFIIELSGSADPRYDYQSLNFDVDGIGIIQKFDNKFFATIYFKTEPSSFSLTYKDGSVSHLDSGNINYNNSLGYYWYGFIGLLPLDQLVSYSGFKYVGSKMSDSELKAYLDANIGSPDPIVNNYQSSLGSFVMAPGQNSWANNFFGEDDYQGVFTSRVQKTTTTGKVAGVDFDSFQFYTGLADCKRSGMVPKSFGTFVDNEIHNGDGLKNGRGGLALDVKYPSDFVSALQQLMNADSGLGNTVQLVFNKILGGGYEFKPIVFLRPFDTKSGAYGDWIRVTSGAVSSSTMNSSGTGSSVTGSSSEDPDSTEFIQNADPVVTTGTTASGTTLDNAINNAITFSPVVNVNPDINVNVNNNVSNELQQIQNASSSSGGQVTGGILSNIVGLLGLVGAVPQMLTVLFSWLPAWSLAVVGVAFALFVPVIIFKLLK